MEIKVIQKNRFRSSGRKVNESYDMIRVTIDFPLYKWRAFKKRYGINEKASTKAEKDRVKNINVRDMYKNMKEARMAKIAEKLQNHANEYCKSEDPARSLYMAAQDLNQMISFQLEKMAIERSKLKKQNQEKTIKKE